MNTHPCFTPELLAARTGVLLCGERPSESLCREWMQDFNDELQGWVLHHISPLTPWATGIGTIDAAWAMASEPEEGEDYDHQS